MYSFSETIGIAGNTVSKCHYFSKETVEVFLFFSSVLWRYANSRATVTMFNLFLPLEVIKILIIKIAVPKPREFLMLWHVYFIHKFSRKGAKFPSSESQLSPPHNGNNESSKLLFVCASHSFLAQGSTELLYWFWLPVGAEKLSDRQGKSQWTWESQAGVQGVAGPRVCAQVPNLLILKSSLTAPLRMELPTLQVTARHQIGPKEMQIPSPGFQGPLGSWLYPLKGLHALQKAFLIPHEHSTSVPTLSLHRYSYMFTCVLPLQPTGL